MTAPLLKVTDLKKHFPQKQQILQEKLPPVRAVDGVSFTLESNRTLGLVGESGCGKSTLGKTILHLTPPTSGEIQIDGKNPANLNRTELRDLRKRAQIIFQDPVSSLNPRMTTAEIMDEPLALHTKLSRIERIAKTRALLDRVGIPESSMEKYPHQFSGGQCQRIAIARALTLNPSLIVADEPVSALDVSVQAQVLNLMLDLQDEFNLSYLFISHDLSVVKFISDDVAVMYLGQIVEQGTAESIVENPRHPYTKALVSVIPRPEYRPDLKREILQGNVPSPANPPAGCRFHTRCPIVQDRCKIEMPELSDGVRCHFVVRG